MGPKQYAFQHNTRLSNKNDNQVKTKIATFRLKFNFVSDNHKRRRGARPALAFRAAKEWERR